MNPRRKKALREGQRRSARAERRYHELVESNLRQENARLRSRTDELQVRLNRLVRVDVERAERPNPGPCRGQRSYTQSE